MLQNPPRFYHIPSYHNHVIIEAYCMLCLRCIGASPSRPMLRIVEFAHRCPKHCNGAAPLKVA